MPLTLKRLPAALLSAALAAPVLAADIDLYAGGSGSGAPNVLFFLDNSSNWSGANQAWDYKTVYDNCARLYSDKSVQATCQGYVNQVFDGGKTASLVQGQVELRVLRLVLNEITCNAASGTAVNINAGLMLFNTQGSVDSSSVTGGYIRQAIKDLKTQCGQTDPTKSIIADLTNIDAKIQDNDFKGPSSAEYGAALYEAFKYFGGHSRPSLVDPVKGAPAATPIGATGFGPVRYTTVTTLEDPLAFTDGGKSTYKSPINDATSCGKNYIILIGNTFPNQEYITDTNASPYPKNSLMTRLQYDPGYQLFPKPLQNNDKTNVRFADEWAKFLYDTDVSPVVGQQNIRTFTINVYNKSESLEQRKLLQSMAAVGRGNSNGDFGGGYFSVGGDLYALIQALKQIVTQIATIDSVFASASLPVSVNAQGSFLNQVFMGVFRPGENGYQRWFGNLKQYKLSLSGSALQLVDANGRSAVDATSGFIDNCAASFWTSDSAQYWKTVTGSRSACNTATNYATSLGYSDLPDGPLVERGGAAQKLRLPDNGHTTRNIRTCSDTSCRTSGAYALVDFTAANIKISNGLNGATSADIVNWARGANLGDGTPEPNGKINYTTYPATNDAGVVTSPKTRPTVHGEVVHSRPLAVNYGPATSNDIVVFYGSGDGMLRAVDGNQSTTAGGSELWAFIAPEHWSATDVTGTWNLLTRLRDNWPLINFPNVLISSAVPKTYFFDGTIGGYQELSSGTVSKLWIYPTMRRGGRLVYAFDVSKRPGTGTSQPTLMWKYGPSENSKMGQSWSTPLAIRVKGTTNPLVVFGAGYDDCEDGSATACDSVSVGKGIVVLDAQSGAVSDDRRVRYIEPSVTGVTTGRFVADLAPVDVDGDGYVDVIYAVDTRGNVWRINSSNPAAGYTGYANGVKDWPVTLVARVSDWSTASERRKFMAAPNVVMLGTQATVLVGTGDREKPLASGSAAAVNNRFYGLRDDVTRTSAVTPLIGYGADSLITDLTNVTSASSTLLATSLKPGGWYRNLFTTSPPYEQVVTTPLTLGGATYFATFQPKSTSTDANQCLNLGTARSYKLDFQTGVISPNSAGRLEPDLFVSQGIPPSPVGGTVIVDGKTVPFCIGCTGPTVLSPQKITPKVKPDRKPVFRYQRID